MNAFVKGLSIFILSLSLFACGDSAEKTAEKGESAIEAMNSMNSEINGYANENLETMTNSELEYRQGRLETYIKHADRAIKSVNDPDVIYYGDKDQIYRNRSLAEDTLGRIRNEVSDRKNPVVIKQKKDKEDLEKLLDDLEVSVQKFTRIHAGLNVQIDRAEDVVKFADLSVKELEEEKLSYLRIQSQTGVIKSLVLKIKNNSSWESFKDELSYSKQQSVETLFEQFEDTNTNIFEGLIGIIDEIIKSKTETQEAEI